ncbi:ABC transporter substrate-binding protein [Microbacterium jejuense]|uniref:ABC transporter substrate-binding protein n=1 Tax=Microbacterium jejuense TaxID=1263637 RepID=UPI0031EBB98A
MTFSRKTARIGSAIIAVGALAALTACSGGAAAKPSEPIEVPGASADANDHMNELYDKAIEEGKTDLVLYGPSVSAQKSLFKVFTDRFPGIKVIPQDQPDAQSITKIEAEAASGSKIADVYDGGESPQVAAEPGICTQADVRTAPEGFEIPTNFDGRLTYYALRYFGFVYNTDMVKDADAPQNWEDLLDPQWKGKISMGDPTVPGGIRYILTSLMVPESEDKWGEAYVEKLADQDVQFAQSEPNVPSDVASGRFPVGIAVYQGFYEDVKAKGGPIKMVFPLDDGGNFMSRTGMCLISDAPHPDSSQLYINWLYSPEGQQALAEKNRSYGWTPEAPGPEGTPSLDQLERLPFSNPDPAFNQPYFDFIDEQFKK